MKPLSRGHKTSYKSEDENEADIPRPQNELQVCEDEYEAMSSGHKTSYGPVRTKQIGGWPVAGGCWLKY